MTPFTDTHCHLDFDRFEKDREQVLQRAWDAGLVWILNPGIDLETSNSAIALAKQFPGKINAAVGIHPNYGKPWSADLLEKLQEISLKPEVVAIGEIGLDYYREHTPHEQQRKMLQAQLSLAEERSLPVVIHNRESTKDLLGILRTWVEGLKGSNNPLAILDPSRFACECLLQRNPVLIILQQQQRYPHPRITFCSSSYSAS